MIFIPDQIHYRNLVSEMNQSVWATETARKLAKTCFSYCFHQHLLRGQAGREGYSARMMLAHRQKFLTEQISEELLTEWKNIEKQKCMSLATTLAELASWLF